MQLDPLDPNGNPWSEAALQVLGATMIAWPPCTGPVVSPDIDLSSYVAALATATGAALMAYANAKQQAIATGGFTVNANTSGASLYISVATDPASMAHLSSALHLAQTMLDGSVAPTVITWVGENGAIPLTPQQVIAVATAIATLIQASFATLGAIISAILGNSITTHEQVEAPPAPIPAWPVNS